MFLDSISTLVGFCEICSNGTPQVFVEEFGQECCEICHIAYGECN